MVDYEIDETFDINIKEEKRIGTVDGLNEFEQVISVRLAFDIDDVVGGLQGNGALKEKIRLKITRTAEQYDVINNIQNIDISEPIDKPETLTVSIFYDTGESFKQNL